MPGAAKPQATPSQVEEKGQATTKHSRTDVGVPNLLRIVGWLKGSHTILIWIVGFFTLCLTKDRIIAEISHNAKAASGGFLHRFMQGAVETTELHSSRSQPVFVKVPRTGSDSLRTCLFADPNVSYVDPSYTEVPERLTNFKGIEEAPYVFGHLSGSEIASYNFSHGPIRLATVLREPTQRALSYYEFVGHRRRDQLSLKEFFTSEDPDIKAFVNNGMVWQLGDHINPAERGRNASEALRAAQCLITRMTAVGFFDDMIDDFDLIHSNLFPEVEGNWRTRKIFKLGMLLRSMQYSSDRWSSKLTAEDAQAVQKAVRLDQELYEFAWRWWKLPRRHGAQKSPCDADWLSTHSPQLDLEPVAPVTVRAAAAHRSRARVLRVEIYSLVFALFFGVIWWHTRRSLGPLAFSNASVFFCLVGLFVSLVLRAILQEFVLVHSNYGRAVSHPLVGGLFLGTCDRLATIIMLVPWAPKALQAVRSCGARTVARAVAAPALCGLAVSSCQYGALDYISFPTQAIARSARPGVARTVRACVDRKATRSEVVAAIVAGVGTCLFAFTSELGGHNESAPHIGEADPGVPFAPTTFLYGAILLLIPFIFQSLGEHLWQSSVSAQKVSRECGIEPCQGFVVVFGTALVGFCVAVPLLLLSGHLVEAVQLLSTHTEARGHVCALSICSALARCFACHALDYVGPFAMNAMMVVQLCISAFVSQSIFAHTCGPIVKAFALVVAAAALLGSSQSGLPWRKAASGPEIPLLQRDSACGLTPLIAVLSW